MNQGLYRAISGLFFFVNFIWVGVAVDLINLPEWVPGAFFIFNAAIFAVFVAFPRKRTEIEKTQR